MDKYTLLTVLAKHFPGSNVSNLMAAVEEITAGVNLTDHDRLVQTALSTPDVIASLSKGSLINAIKALRSVSNASLLEAKNAVEDWRVKGVYYVSSF